MATRSYPAAKSTFIRTRGPRRSPRSHAIRTANRTAIRTAIHSAIRSAIRPRRSGRRRWRSQLPGGSVRTRGREPESPQGRHATRVACTRLKTELRRPLFAGRSSLGGLRCGRREGPPPRKFCSLCVLYSLFLFSVGIAYFFVCSLFFIFLRYCLFLHYIVLYSFFVFFLSVLFIFYSIIVYLLNYYCLSIFFFLFYHCLFVHLFLPLSSL